MVQTFPVKDENNGFRINIINQAALDLTSDVSGDVEIIFPHLKEVYYADLAFANKGYFVAIQSISGNAVTFRVYMDTGSAAAFTAVASENIDATCKAIAFGR